LALLACSSVLCSSVFSLTLEEAMDEAVNMLPSYRAQAFRVKAARARYNASRSPYWPTLDVSGNRYEKHSGGDGWKQNAFDATVSYTLYDGGRRRAGRDISGLNENVARQTWRQLLLDLEFDVKSGYYTLMAQEEILKQRKLQLKDTRKDLEIARGRKSLGVARRSDVLQASVRLQQARIDLRTAEGERIKARSRLNSLLGKPLNDPVTTEGGLPLLTQLPAWKPLSRETLKRPEVRQARDAFEIAVRNKQLEDSAFYPDFSLDVSYSETETEGILSDSDTESASAAILGTWNVFEYRKYYDCQAAVHEIHAAEKQIDEVLRQLLLELRNTYEDAITEREKLTLARQQLKTAEFNYQQALGEYRTGKGDVLALVTAEKLLADARLQFSTSRLNLALSKAALERAAGIKNLETLPAATASKGERR
jgi:outer membrane protein TolC